MELVTRCNSLSHSAFAALRRRVTWRLTKGIDTVFEPDPWELLVLLVLAWDWMGLRTVSGENTRGLGGCLRGKLESDM